MRRRSWVRPVVAPPSCEDMAEERREQELLERLRKWRELKPPERYGMAATLMGEYGYTSEGVARVIGAAGDVIRRWARRGGLPPAVRTRGNPVSPSLVDLVATRDRPGLSVAEAGRMLGIAPARVSQARRVLREMDNQAG